MFRNGDDRVSCNFSCCFLISILLLFAFLMTRMMFGEENVWFSKSSLLPASLMMIISWFTILMASWRRCSCHCLCPQAVSSPSPSWGANIFILHHDSRDCICIMIRWILSQDNTERCGRWCHVSVFHLFYREITIIFMIMWWPNSGTRIRVTNLIIIYSNLNRGLCRHSYKRIRL